MDKKEHAGEGSQAQKTRYHNLLCSTSHEEIVDVQDELKGRIIGKKRWFQHHIEEYSGARLVPCDAGFRIRGNDEQREQAKKIIREKLDGTNARQNPIGKTNRKVITYIPDNLKGYIIGKGRETLSRISTETGARLGTQGREIYIDGSPDAIRNAHIKIKGRLCTAREVWLLKQVKKIFMDSINLTEAQDLSLVSVPSHPWSGPHYELHLIGEDFEEGNHSDEPDLEKNVRETLLDVLRRLREHESIEDFELDLWCHFGHAFVGDVDEGEEGEVSFADVKGKLESGEWKERFRPGMENAEVTELENALSEKARSLTDDVRHDFYFYTPSARKVKVKTWLMKEVGSDDSMVFSLTPPYALRGIRKRVMFGDPTEETSSKKPCFFLCVPYQKVLLVDVVAPASQFDCRYVLRASEKHPESTVLAEEEDKVLCEYLSAMQIVGDRIVLPADRQLPEDFQQIYDRRSVRRTYEYPSEVGTFILTVSQESQKEGDELDHEDDTPTKTDVLLHYEDWSSGGEENTFNPEHVTSKFSHFMQFVRNVQRIIKHPKQC